MSPSNKPRAIKDEPETFVQLEDSRSELTASPVARVSSKRGFVVRLSAH